MARKPRADMQDRELAWFAEFQALDLEEQRFRYRALGLHLDLNERQMRLLESIPAKRMAAVVAKIDEMEGNEDGKENGN
jgi:hypothetical protein